MNINNRNGRAAYLRGTAYHHLQNYPQATADYQLSLTLKHFTFFSPAALERAQAGLPLS
jgi:hypothetical protein